MIYTSQTIYTKETAAEILNIAPQSIEKWIEEGKLKRFKVFDALYITEHELDRFLGMNEKLFSGNGNISKDGEPLGEFAEAQLSQADFIRFFYPSEFSQ